MRDVKRIVIHCSDSDDKHVEIDAKEIDSWHRNRGFDRIGYHFIIKKNGTIEMGRGLDEIGAHTKGYNQDSIGICWVGRNDLNKNQKISLIVLVRGLISLFRLDPSDVDGHYELNPHKTCPNLDMDEVRSWL